MINWREKFSLIEFVYSVLGSYTRTIVSLDKYKRIDTCVQKFKSFFDGGIHEH